ILGSKNAQPGAWPWIVSIQKKEKNFVHVCAGTLIAQQWVLTAAHCFRNTRAKRRVLVGGTHLVPKGPRTQVHNIRTIIVHEDYDNVTHSNDIALVELDQPVQCSPFVKHVCMPNASLQIQELTNCYVSGWGATKAGSARKTPVLQEARVKLQDLKKCNSSGWYRGALHPYNLCAQYPKGGINTCQGDSAGPLLCQDTSSGQFSLVGVTSRGRGCARTRRPGVYTAIQPFGDWILAQMG
ncbi:ACRO protein, partial [Crotophaga sulcirostris]|nr:ACRO protein [Crotophaga sulcirostris]